MNSYLSQIEEGIKEADLVVVGLGEEWNLSPKVGEDVQLRRILTELGEKPQYQWILPYVYYQMSDDTLKQAYKTLFGMLEGKNYFVVATTVNRGFLPYVKQDRLVMPCGSDLYMQDAVLSVSCEQVDFLRSLDSYIKGEISLEEVSFVRNEQGDVVPFNTIYAPDYREEGYLPMWGKYMSWLQGTMNRRTCLLELGAGLQFPSVFRFPFEKMAYFNKKAICFRVHKSLYHLTEEMAERSVSVPMHAVELFGGL